MGMEPNLDAAISKMILSASGWRGVFAENNDEESRAREISQEHRIIAAAAAKVFSDYLKTQAPEKNIVIVGRDTRPSGEAIAAAVIQALLSEGRELRYTGVSAAPEIMAFARSCGKDDGDSNAPAAGFIYISASHNPVGHNGIKFGLTDGGVLQAEEAAKLSSAFGEFMAAPDRVDRAKALLGGKDESSAKKLNAAYLSVLTARESWKNAALAAYRDFSAEVISGSACRAAQGEFFDAVKKGLEKRPLGIAADFNGSARTVSIDREFLSSLGLRFYGMNETPGEIAHRIVPEGESLDYCRAFLEELHSKDPSVILGYMPDCDGDRGNLVIWDEGKMAARNLEAQEVFALACLAELSSLVWTGELTFDINGKSNSRPALAVNDPTSMRIDRIAKAFGAKVFRAEVGEANVVGLARKLRGEGYLVRILGEGSAGGNITHPSAVRDPIDTLAAIVKLLAIRSDSGRKGIFEIWCNLSNQTEIYREDFVLSDIIASLPAFVSTGAYSDDALLMVKTGDHGLLKDRYQKIFLREWEDKKNMLKAEFGISDWEAIAYNGITERRGIKRFGEAGRGGLKIEFFAGSAKAGTASAVPALACIWMRGSGTEPVFRVMADTEGSSSRLERFLIEWQRRMVLEADN